MMLELFEEPFPPSGTADASARDNAFGTTKLTTWERLLRETLQNSWDARAGKPTGRIAFSVGLRTLHGEADRAFREQLFGDRPRHHPSLTAQLDASRPIELLIITDRGTVGLAGATNSAEETEDDAPTNYKDLILNFGNDASKPSTDGGTYGIGKAVLFRASAASTCVVYSQFREGGRIRSRLIAVGSAERFISSGWNCTGRHFWGVSTEGRFGKHIDPLQDQPARELAAAIGMTDQLGPTDTGTAIAVVAPERGELSPRQLVEQIRDAALLWAWPHLVRTGPGGLPQPSVAFSFDVETVQVPLDNPLTHPVLRHFARAFQEAERAVRGEEQTDPIAKVELLRRQVKATEPPVGVLTYRETPGSTAPTSDDDPSSGDRVALIRPTPLFVVEYLDVSPRQARDLTTRGVFLVDSHHETKFAKAEPVAHDRWDPPRRSKTNEVHFALERIRELTRPRELDARRQTEQGSLRGLARISSELGKLMTFGSGRGGGATAVTGRPDTSRTGSGSPASGISVVFQDRVAYSTNGAERTTEFFASVRVAASEQYWSLVADPFVVVGEGQREKVPPSEASRARVLGWRLPDGEFVVDADPLPIGRLLGGTFSVTLAAPPDCAVSLNLIGKRTAMAS